MGMKKGRVPIMGRLGGVVENKGKGYLLSTFFPSPINSASSDKVQVIIAELNERTAL